MVGGTSASTPLWAAYLALVNASSACRGQDIGFANPALYQIAARSYAANFNDITAASPYTALANNDTFDGTGTQPGEPDVDDPNNLFPITGGYDMATGLGSPIGSTLAAYLCGIRFSVSMTNPGSQSTVLGQPVSLPVQGADSGGSGLSYAASGLPAGLSINAATGVISGTPTAVGRIDRHCLRHGWVREHRRHSVQLERHPTPSTAAATPRRRFAVRVRRVARRPRKPQGEAQIHGARRIERAGAPLGQDRAACGSGVRVGA